MSELMPELVLRKIAPEKLIPDPNNPGLITNDLEHYEDEEALDLLDRTITRMRGVSEEDVRKDRYRIKELERSIVENGWWPIDCIFVKGYGHDGYYLVLEGNRRVIAIRNLRNSDETSAELKKTLNLIEVMEIVGEEDEEILRAKVTYLLGVRHHGSLKKWTPFAQAHNIYSRYMELAEQDSEAFKWDVDLGQQVANALSIELKEVANRLRVYRAMEQLNRCPIMENAEGKIQDRYYSVTAEVVLSGDKALRQYVNQSDTDFTLDDESVERMVNLCHFELPGREGSPINNPQEWRKLANILKEEDEARKTEMLEAVEKQKEKPSDVWAERASELQKLSWDKWLFKVDSIIRKINIGQVDINNEDARAITQDIVEVISKLDSKDVEGEVGDA